MRSEECPRKTRKISIATTPLVALLKNNLSSNINMNNFDKNRNLLSQGHASHFYVQTCICSNNQPFIYWTTIEVVWRHVSTWWIYSMESIRCEQKMSYNRFQHDKFDYHINSSVFLKGQHTSNFKGVIIFNTSRWNLHGFTWKDLHAFNSVRWKLMDLPD